MHSTIYRCITVPLEAEDLRILGIGLHELMPNELVHRYQSNYLLAIFHSEATIRLHGITRHCTAQSLIVWEPEVCQHFGNAALPWEYSWITCDGPFLHAILDTLSIPRNDVILLS